MATLQFAKRKAAPDVRRRPNAIIGKNQMLWDLGLDHFDMEDVEKVKSYIWWVICVTTGKPGLGKILLKCI